MAYLRTIARLVSNGTKRTVVTFILLLESVILIVVEERLEIFNIPRVALLLIAETRGIERTSICVKSSCFNSKYIGIKL
jgi:hypothetical protein